MAKLFDIIKAGKTISCPEESSINFPEISLSYVACSFGLPLCILIPSINVTNRSGYFVKCKCTGFPAKCSCSQLFESVIN